MQLCKLRYLIYAFKQIGVPTILLIRFIKTINIDIFYWLSSPQESLFTCLCCGFKTIWRLKIMLFCCIKFYLKSPESQALRRGRLLAFD